ncbi:P-loop containing nucleoside triphosphate hydrolase protein [Mycena rebaudengoi]|nr:P-loop containing nucleoside triphosphate hydrolase protein [Mycena rebaudengoi]
MSVAQLNINASVHVTQAQPPPVTTVCPPPSQMFHGRRDILDKMHTYFSQDIGRRHVSLLHGLGGAGKTQICLKFLDETDKSRFTDVFFLDASGIDTIKNGLKNIALTRSIGSEDEDASRWLASSQDEWLLIFDNADDPSINLFNYFPRSSRGNILITSRNPELSVHAPNSHHHISDMEEEDAVQLLLASALQPLSTETESLATDIVKALYCFPLAVVQAGSFIARTGTLRKYLALYKQNRAKLLSMLPSQSHDEYAWSVYTTWDISFKCLGPLAARFLQICSFLHHEGISEAIFSNAATYKKAFLGPTEEEIQEPRQFLDNLLTQSRTWDELQFAEIIAEIRGYSLINQDPNTNLFSIHPMVHEWSSKTITDTTSTRQCCAAMLAMSTMSLENDQVFLISLLPHINSVLREDRQLAHKFSYPYHRVFYDSGHFDHAQELCVALLENKKRIVGSEHPETLFVMKELAAIYGQRSKYMDAEELGVAVLQKRKQLFGTEHPDTLHAMSNLATTYHRLGKFTDAEDLYVMVLEKRKQILGPKHPQTLDAMSSLASTYHSLGKFTDAEELKVAVLDKRKQILGSEHPDTLYAMSNLAATYRSLGKLTDAEELEVAVLDKRKQFFGTEHPDTLDAMSNLASTYRSLGKFADAEELEVAVLEKRKQILGPEHPKTLHTMSSLATTYHSLGKFVRVEELDLAVLEKRKRLFGTEHPDTLDAMSNLAATYRSLGKFAGLEELDLAVLEKRKQLFGTEHPDTLHAMSSLAATYWKLGKFTDAEELEVAVLEKRKQLFGTEHPETLNSMRHLALIYRDMEKFTEAEHLLLAVLEQKTSTLGPEHKETLQAQEYLTEMRQHMLNIQ